MELSSRLLDNTSSRPQEVRAQYVFPDCAWDERASERTCDAAFFISRGIP